MTQSILRLDIATLAFTTALLSACGGGSDADSAAGSATTADDGAASAASVKSEKAQAVVASGKTLVVRARGSIAGNVGPKMDIRVDGVVVAGAEVRSSTYTDYTFSVPQLVEGTKLDIVYTNDALVNKVDRNLEIESYSANGSTVHPEAANGVFDRGSGAAAFDGVDVRPSQRGMWWNGALRFTIGAAPVAASTPDSATLNAARLADQATFGPTEALMSEIRTLGSAKWISAQQALSKSRYTLGGSDAIHRNTSTTNFCEQSAYKGANCGRDWYSGMPLLWDFYRNATRQPDQLRQRVAFALQQIVVVSDLEIAGTYGLRNYHNMLLDNAFGNYRQVLKKVLLSPVMGDFLNNVNNDKAAPNENMGRELLQLFSIGTCALNADGSLKGGTCTATYDNDTVRNYAYALTGWTYPAGGAMPWACWPAGTNCTYYGGDMVPAAMYHDANTRQLLSGVTVPASATAPQALELVLDSLMNHANTAPFMSRQLIQHLVSSNPSPAYVQRVAAAFTAGKYTSAGTSFGAGQRGDLAATVAAVLLDAEARTATPARGAGKLREPALMLTGVLRALNGSSDGDSLSWTWGATLNQHLFRPPSVFNYYPPTYPISGTALVGPSFGIHNSNTALTRLNYLTFLLYWGGSTASATVPGAFGTTVNLTPFETDADNPAKLVDRVSVLATGAILPEPIRGEIVAAVATFTSRNNAKWKTERVKQAAFLVFASPNYQVQR